MIELKLFKVMNIILNKSQASNVNKFFVHLNKSKIRI